MTQKLSYRYLDSPVGKLLLVRSGGLLKYLSFPTGSRKITPSEKWEFCEEGFDAVITQLNFYFEGKLKQFDLDFALDGTEFQLSVWTALQAIPYGTTTTYSYLAHKVGRPTAYRAAGAANGANPLPIIIPCHRIIGQNSTLRGFGGGIETKKFLLNHEKRHARASSCQEEAS